MPSFPFLISLTLSLLLPTRKPKHQVVITIDDLPVVSVLPLSEAQRDSITTGIHRAIRSHHIPAIGFVNEGKLYDSSGTLVPARVELLKRWLDQGLELGNHTYSHRSLNRIPLSEYEDEIVKGETILRSLLAQRGKSLRYFRHPFLMTGRSIATRDSLNQFLAQHGYQVAPVTIDNSDYVFAAAYDRARAGGDPAEATKIRTIYLEYMDSVAAFYERQAVAIVGRDLPQILLMHANRLNADALDALASIYQRRGYQFITLEQALRDSAYSTLPDRYDGPAGITWLHRWAMTAKLPKETYRGEPEVPDWIAKAAEGN